MAMTETDLSAFFADKAEMRRIVEEQNRIMGFVHDPALAALKIEEVQAMVGEDLRRHGIRPEDNDASCAIIAARHDY